MLRLVRFVISELKASGPGQTARAATRTNALVHVMDLMPTFLEVAAEAPDRVAELAEAWERYAEANGVILPSEPVAYARPVSPGKYRDSRARQIVPNPVLTANGLPERSISAMVRIIL